MRALVTVFSICTLLLFVGGALAANHLFDSRIDYVVGEEPSGVILEDIDHDGDDDMVVACQSTDSIYVLYCDGEGGFGDPVGYEVGRSPFHLCAADFNGDGWEDLAVTQAYVDTISVWFNDQDGTFTFNARYSYGGGSYGYSPIAADFDGDTDLDIAFGNPISGRVQIMTNNGDGTFVDWLNLTTGQPYGVAAADIDGDLDIDLVCTDDVNNLVRVFENDNNTGFLAPVNVALINPMHVILEKLDADDDYDMVVAYYNGIIIYTNDGSGTFTAGASYPITDGNARYVCAVDIDGDTDRDLAVACEWDYLYVFESNGDGTFEDGVQYVTGAYAISVGFGDIDTDGDKDLAIANNDGVGVSVLTNDGAGDFSFGNHFPANRYPTSVAVAYFNDDTRPDIVVSNRLYDEATSCFSVLLSNGDKTFQPVASYYPTEFINPEAICAGDFDGDGYDDIGATDTCLNILINEAGTGFSSHFRYPCDANNHPMSLKVADLNNDTYPDVIGAYDQIQVFINQGTGTGEFYPAVNYDAYDDPVMVDIIDLDNDNDLDLVVADEYDYYVCVLFNEGDGTFAAPIVIEVNYYYPLSICAADFNGDGNADFAFATYDSDLYMTVMLNNGDSTWTETDSYPISEDAYSMYAEDFDNDGDYDIALSCNYANSVSIFVNDGNAVFEHAHDYGTDGYPLGLAVADFDADGDQDIATGNYDAFNVSVLWNRLEIITDVAEGEPAASLPKRFGLSQNYPNPFNPTTTIKYDLPTKSDVKIKIYNLLGQQVRVFNEGTQTAGEHFVVWNGRTNDGTAVATGLYLYRLEAGDFTGSKKMLLLK